MSESKFSNVSCPQIDSASANEKLYVILSLFLASRGISDECNDEIGCPFRTLLDSHEEELLTRLLIESAVLIRMKDDLFQKNHGISSHASLVTVGSLFKKEKSEQTDLNLRESCNKIIHAKQLTFDRDREEEIYRSCLNPRIYLYGSKDNKNWKAELDIKRWVAQASRMFV